MRPQAPFAGYGRPDAPMRSFAGLIVLYNALLGTLLWWAKRSGRLPGRVAPGEVVLVGVATHKASRLLAKDRVTAVLRAPFTEFQGEGHGSEVNEAARGQGPRRAIGELVT